MKNLGMSLSLPLVMILGLIGCANPDKIDTIAKNQSITNEQGQETGVAEEPALTLADTLLADLESNLRGVKSAQSTQSKMQVMASVKNLKLSETQIQVILATARMSLEQAQLGSSNNLAALIPVLIQGATAGIGALQTHDSTQLTGLLSALGNSVLNSVVNVSQDQVPTALLKSLAQSLFAGFGASGVGPTNIQGIANSVIGMLLSRLHESNLSTTGFDVLLQNLATGAIGGLGQLNMPQALFASVLQSLGSGSLSGLTSLVTQVLGPIKTNNPGSAWLNQLLNAFTSGVQGALVTVPATGSVKGLAGSFLASFIQGLSGGSVVSPAPATTPATTPSTTQTTTGASSVGTIIGIVAGIARLWLL